MKILHGVALRGIGSVMSVYSGWFGEFPRFAAQSLRGAAKQRNFKTRKRGKPPSDVKLRLTVYSGHPGFGSPVLAKEQMRHFDVEILAIETVVCRGFWA